MLGTFVFIQTQLIYKGHQVMNINVSVGSINVKSQTDNHEITETITQNLVQQVSQNYFK